MKKIVNGIEVEMTQEEIDQKNSESLAWEQKQLESEWLRNRLKAYPSIGDQLDMIYWDKVNGTNIWVDLITSIKNQFPKPL